jgi:hypothetical protein
MGWAPPRPKLNEPLVTALVRAFYWQSLLDAGKIDTVSDLAHANRLNPSYVARMLRLTLLAPDIVEAILDGKQPSTMQLHPLSRTRLPSRWKMQRKTWGPL